MLYLAEVQKQRGGLLSGSSKTELKLLACQRSDQNWNNVSEETITADEASKMNDGALILVELSPNKQVQRIQEAGRPLVNILQNFSRQVEKFKLKEDEIDQWKQSLMFQVQELNRREMDMESRWEQLQNLEGEVERLETEKQEIESAREEIENLKEEVERKNQELEGDWEHLRGEQRRLDEMKADSDQAQILDEQQSSHIAELFNRLSDHSSSTASLQENINFVFEFVEKQQTVLTPHWEKLESDSNLVQEQQGEIEQLSQTVGDRQSNLQQLQSSLDANIVQVEQVKAQLSNKTELSELLKQQLENQENFYQNGKTLVAMAESMAIQHDVDVETLQKLPLQELEKLVNELRRKLEIDSGFVRDQEQELQLKDEFIKELEAKIEESSSEEKHKLESEIAEEKDLYAMLNKSLRPQRNNLIKQEQIFHEHEKILLQKQGHSVTNSANNNIAELKLILNEIETQREKDSQEINNLEKEIQELNAEIETKQKEIEAQTNDLESQSQELKSMEEQLLNLQTANAECCGRVNFYRESLQPIQDSLDAIKEKVQTISDSLNGADNNGNSQQETINEMRQTLQSLVSSPQLLAY